MRQIKRGLAVALNRLEGVVFAVGPQPEFDVYERDDSLKVVVSIFNLTCEVEDVPPNGFVLTLRPSAEKQAGAAVFRSAARDADRTSEGSTGARR